MKKDKCIQKNIVTLFDEKSECCGCSACMAVCPRSAIIMVEDEEGFLYPFINDKLCIKCHLCIGTCPCRFYR